MLIALAIVAIGFLILIHEFGHFLLARAFRMRVDSFSIGFGPALLSFHTRRTEYRLSLLPLGGYVRIAGMAPGDGTAADDPASFLNRPAWQRFLVILAGPAINWLFAFLLLASLFMAGMQRPSEDPVIGRVADGSPAAVVGLQPGDRIAWIDGQEIGSWPDMVAAIKKHVGQPMPVRIERDGREIVLTPKIGPDATLGIVPKLQTVQLGFGDAVSTAFFTTGEVVQKTLAALGQMLRGRGQAQLVGPVGIVSETVEAARTGAQSLAGVLVMISLALALMNLLPLPALDGGRLVFIAIAMVRRRPVDAKVEAVIHGIGLLLLLGLVLYATYGDIGRQFSKLRAPPPPAPSGQQSPGQPPPTGR